jgi:hypothetical protein
LKQNVIFRRRSFNAVYHPGLSPYFNLGNGAAGQDALAFCIFGIVGLSTLRLEAFSLSPK